jgi:hypothetical protein
MNINFTKIININLCLILFIYSLSISAESNETYPVINSNSILTSDYLSSAYHRVDSIDIKNGFYHFIVESDIGNYNISSLALFKKRVNEIKTISRAIVSYEQQDDEFSDELRSQLRVTGDSAFDILTSPFSTASNLAGQLTSNLNATFEGADPFVAKRSTIRNYEPKDATTATHKRNIAFQLGLDMYTSNMKVQSFLNTVANARSSGKVSAGVGLSNVITNQGNVSELDLKISYLIKNKTLAELNNYNVEVLSGARINSATIKAFIDNPIYSPSKKTIISTYISKLENVSRLDSLIKLILTAGDEVNAFLYVQICKMLLHYYDDVEKFTAFYNYKGQPAVITNSRRIIFFDPVDFFIWSEENQNIYKMSAEHAQKSGYKGWGYVSSGSVSALASQSLSELKFMQHSNFLD